ncbi:HEAT repeat domain-containing protein [Bremerella sp. JC817]|uniref:HEAT repeat domain-containing protein n=1 Tax=Bremerella sp. JC817 TaxID=3231756 RepID=UPI0034587BB2
MNTKLETAMSARLMFLCAAMLFCGTLSAAETDTQQLVADLKAGGDKAYAAADDLADAPAAEAIPALTAALDSDDEELQRRAARAIAQFGKEASSATPVLVKLLDSPLPKVRAYAAYAIGKIDTGSNKVVPQLIKLITDEDAMVRHEALEAMLEMDVDPNVSLPILVKVLENAEPAMVLPVLTEMAEKGEKALPRLKMALKNPKAAYWACLVAAEMGKTAAPVVPELAAVLDNADAETRMHALIALGEIGPESKPALDRVIKTLDSDPVPAVKYSAAFALAAMEDQKASDALQKAAEGEDAFLTLMSYYALAKLHPEDKQKMATAATFLVEAMKNENPNVRAAAARCLANLGAPSSVVQPIIADALNDADPRVVVNITDAIVKMGPQILPKVAKGLQDEKMRWVSVTIIRRWGEAAPEAVAPLAEALTASDDPQFQAELLMTLGAIGEKSAGALEAITPFLKSDSRTLQLDALYALGRIGNGAVSAKADVMPLLTSEDGFTEFAAAWSLAHIAPEDEDVATKAIPVLVKHLNDTTQDYIPSEAAQALAMFGVKAKSALPQLKAAADAGNEAAAEAIKAISK